MLIPVILSGGSGTRLWPLSRELYPKQMLALVGEGTMLQETLTRLSGVESVGAPIVVCNEHHRFLVAEQLREMGSTPQAIVLEPMGRNTAPAVAIAALAAVADAASRDADPILLVLPADHVIQDVAAFQRALSVGVAAATDGKLVTFGVVPTKPETGYGYIRRANGSGPAFPIAQFVEKPDLPTAQRYVDSKEYFWNSGMFMFRASAVLGELQSLAPKIYDACALAYSTAQRDSDFTRLPSKEFGDCPSDSFDYAVMEKTDRGVVVPLDAQWNDVGSWSALHEARNADAHGNVCLGDVLAIDSRGSYLQSTSRLLAAVGLENHVVVETSDAVMVAPMNRVQDVKDLVSALKKAKRREAASHRKITRAWGSFDRLFISDEFQILHLSIRSGASLSVKIPSRRIEHWTAVAGEVLIDGKLVQGRSVALAAEQSHEIKNAADGPAEIVLVGIGAWPQGDSYFET
jgi:mannose-1-phosphate guanylyltransferase/mannose-6-phosphate isomerase